MLRLISLVGLLLGVLFDVLLDVLRLLAGVVFSLLNAVWDTVWQRVARWIPLWLRLALLVVLAVFVARAVLFVPVPPPALADSTHLPLFQGVTYVREMRGDPRPLVIHIVEVNLAAPGVEFLVTPPEDPGNSTLDPRRTSDYLAEFGLQVAINGAFYQLTESPNLFERLFDQVGALRVLGMAASRGETYGRQRRVAPTIYLSERNEVSLGEPVGEVYNAISGDCVFLLGGETQPCSYSGSSRRSLHPRTAIGYSADRTILYLIVVDGRQAGFSEGVSLEELAAIAREFGLDSALNLDGGGSSTLVMADADGDPLVLNSPIDSGIVRNERPVANHVGVYALPLE